MAEGPKNRLRAMLSAGAAIVAMATTSGCASINASTPGGGIIQSGPGGTTVALPTGTNNTGRVGGTVYSNGQICPSVYLPASGWVNFCLNAPGTGQTQAPTPAQTGTGTQGPRP